MFTGIVETTGTIKRLKSEGTNLVAWIDSSITAELKPDQSLSHDGVCLTVESIENNTYRVSAIAETLAKTALGSWKTGGKVNLERAMKMNDRLDGHIVQGHVDTTATCVYRENKSGSWLYSFAFPSKFAAYIIEKGSICVNGISLTAFDVSTDRFSVAIIPYTFEHTGIKDIQPGMKVNLEFDMVGKYILRSQELKTFTNPISQI
ncbi:riboflavin synthase [Pollutibacter soli]|uniref:riboflavin synthase n=1 Tax=Pollutibacter soli TaxID=3034157 RepID=UPI003013DC42